VVKVTSKWKFVRLLISVLLESILQYKTVTFRTTLLQNLTFAAQMRNEYRKTHFLMWSFKDVRLFFV
jgi:hypothetical protein